MEKQSEAEHRNIRNPKTKKKRESELEFELCKVCNLNHNQGIRHKYFPNHKKSLSSFLSRFRNKISHISFFLQNPSFFDPQRASHNRFWCVFCDTDVHELNTSFACSNAINHLASVNHLKNLKQFAWKYGGSMDQLEAFTVSEADVAKWEKKCTALQKEAALLSEECHGQVSGTTSDIHKQFNHGNVDKFDFTYSHSVKSRPSNSVLPLQYHTNEYQVSDSGISGASNGCVLPYYNTSALPSGTCSGANSFHSKDLVEGSCHALPCSSRQWPSDVCSGKEVPKDDGRMLSSFEGLPDPSPISLGYTENVNSNGPSEAPPPWLTDGLHIHDKAISCDVVSPLSKSGKSRKLNPKRVGAAWAERRKIELEMEKRGESVKKDYDANWLPNFGRVWQSGTRKESRKEFEREKQKLFNVEVEPEIPVKRREEIWKKK